MKVALVTCRSMGDYNNNVESEDDLLLRHLQQKELEVTLAVWDDLTVEWGRFDAVVVKSPWDYFDKINAFYGWLKEMEQQKVLLLNPAQVMRWNADKLYLRDIEAAGFPVVPTIWFNKGDIFQPDQLFKQLQAEKVVVKPRVSGGSKNTFAFSLEEAEQEADGINDLFAQEAFMVQTFLPEVLTQGEWSFIFFRGAFSHAVRKKAKSGDFRVQHYLGGIIETPEVPVHLLRQAQELASHFATNCLYARVDGVEVREQLILMELELIEPFLFLFTHPHSLDRYYEALRASISDYPAPY
jgi:glutathione synthase/RimK-type ligase-like ATP-grasp enzyme